MGRIHRSTAIVVGAGMAGLVAARVLSDHFDHVTVFERDPLPDEPVPRRGVPQAHHAHTVLAGGWQSLSAWFPGLSEELVAGGTCLFDIGDTNWHQAGGAWIRLRVGRFGAATSLPLLETTVRKHLARSRLNVTVRDVTPVDTLLVQGDRVVGVRSHSTDTQADLIVICAGRTSRFLDQLPDHGFPAPPVSEIGTDLALSSCEAVFGQTGIPDSPTRIFGGPGHDHRFGIMAPAAGGRMIITLGSFHGEAPPAEASGFERFARGLPSPEIADSLARARSLSPVLTLRLPASRRRHVERLTRLPAGLLVLGDALCVTNPIHGQGISSAARQGWALADALRRYGPDSLAVVRGFYRSAARAVDPLWQMARLADFADARTTGSRPFGMRLRRRYQERLHRTCQTSD